MRIYVTSCDPGFATGAMSHLAPEEERYKLGNCWSLPKTIGTDLQRVDQATAWFCGHLDPWPETGNQIVRILSLEDQHGAAHGSSRDGHSSANVAYVREVVGGIRRHCYTLGIPIRMITPVEWRTRLGLPRNASKQQAWRVVANAIKLPKEFGNEHVRDACVIAYVGSIAVHLWLANWLRERRAA